MSQLKVTSDNPEISFDLHWGQAAAHVMRNDGWEIIRARRAERLGMKSLHWTSALRRAVERMERNGK